MISSLLRSEPLAIRQMIGSSRSGREAGDVARRDRGVVDDHARRLDARPGRRRRRHRRSRRRRAWRWPRRRRAGRRGHRAWDRTLDMGVGALLRARRADQARAAFGADALSRPALSPISERMSVHFHEEDLPAGVLGDGPGRRRHRDDGPAARPRPAVPGADLRRPRRRASRPLRARARTMPRRTSRRCSPIRTGSSSIISPASISPRSRPISA